MALATDEHVVERKSKISDISNRHTMDETFHKGRQKLDPLKAVIKKVHLDDALEPVRYGT